MTLTFDVKKWRRLSKNEDDWWLSKNVDYCCLNVKKWPWQWIPKNEDDCLKMRALTGHTLSYCKFEGKSDLTPNQGLRFVHSLKSSDLIGRRVLFFIIKGSTLISFEFKLSAPTRQMREEVRVGAFRDWIPTQCPHHTNSGSVPPPDTLLMPMWDNSHISE